MDKFKNKKGIRSIKDNLSKGLDINKRTLSDNFPYRFIGSIFRNIQDSISSVLYSSISPNLRDIFLDKTLSSYIDIFVDHINSHKGIIKPSQYLDFLYASSQNRDILIYLWDKEISKSQFLIFSQDNGFKFDLLFDVLEDRFLDDSVLEQDYHNNTIKYNNKLDAEHIKKFFKKNWYFDASYRNWR